MPTHKGTIKELFNLREAYRSIHRAKDSMEWAGLDSSSLQAQLDELADTRLVIDVPCVICKRPFPQITEVVAPGDPYPHAVLCEECNASTEAEIQEERRKQ